MGQTFLDLARTGRAEGWRYLVGFVLIVLLSQITGGALALAVMGHAVKDLVELATTGQVKAGLSPRLFLAMNLPSVTLILGVWLVLLALHERPFLTLITPRRSFAVGRMLQGFGVWFVLQIAALGLSYALDPHGLKFHWDLPRLLPFVALALLITPLQTGGEELVFRGYILQGLSLLTRRPWLLCFLNGLLFMLPHLVNPEMSYGALPMALSYFGVGMFLAVVALRDNRLELAIGAHWANNLFDGIIAHTEVSTLPTPSLFTVAQAFPWPSLAVLVVSAAIFYVVVFWPWGKAEKAE